MDVERILHLAVRRDHVHVVLVDTPVTALSAVEAAVQNIDASLVRNALVLVLVKRTPLNNNKLSQPCRHVVVLEAPLGLSSLHHHSPQDNRNVSPRPSYCTIDFLSLPVMPTASSSMAKHEKTSPVVAEELPYLRSADSSDTKRLANCLLTDVQMRELDTAVPMYEAPDTEALMATKPPANKSIYTMETQQYIGRVPLLITIPRDHNDALPVNEFKLAWPSTLASASLQSLRTVTVVNSTVVDILKWLQDILAASAIAVTGEAAQDCSFLVNLAWRQEAKFQEFYSLEASIKLEEIYQDFKSSHHSTTSALLRIYEVIDDLTRALFGDSLTNRYSDDVRCSSAMSKLLCGNALTEQTLPLATRLLARTWHLLTLSQRQLHDWAGRSFALPIEDDVRDQLLSRAQRLRLLQLSDRCLQMHTPLQFVEDSVRSTAADES
ncbi:uncharacterized protein LOC108668135 [Hyalella azteca]|uniref:Uncharacterized protein LOC108668135 n=1 Tax=Hyalella azteca TaxID=294128 RepID=A0A8B7NB22_HYAAZ|nr:uncharacterized protein LOC108668135 [Hyalella azteca]